MASTPEIILNSFLRIAGDQWAGVGIADLLPNLATWPAGTSAEEETGGGSGTGDVLERLATSLLGGAAVNSAVSAVSAPSGGSSGSSTWGRVVSKVFGSALGMAPLAKGIISLFTGDSKEPEPPLVKYALPPHLRFEAANGPGLLGVDYGQNGLARAQAYPEVAGGRSLEAPAQVTVQVNAMDSRSFLDHKEEIARAVREAMLNMHSLNDVVSDL